MPDSDDAIADTTSGPVRGVRVDGLTLFRGIPYAAAPVGDLRWRAAVPHEGWSDVRAATTYGHTAPQPYRPGGDPILGGHGEPPFDEDCLTLNVWTPGVDDAKRAVLVWIHGGGFLTGSANLGIYDGSEYAEHGDLVVVGINYRTGPLGFLCGLGETNVWLSDQVAALRWVSDNIGAFGGDPERVTLVGQSGGGFSIGALAGHPQTSRSFGRAILQSPPLGLQLPTPDEALTRTRALADALGHDDIEGLRNEPWDRLLQGTLSVLGRFGTFGEWNLAYLPVLDETMPRHPVDVLADSDCDLILGWTRDEATFRFGLDVDTGACTTDQVLEWATRRYGAHAAALTETYRRARPAARPVDVLTDLLTDELFRMGCLRVLEARANRRPAWAFQFDYPAQSHDGALGATHCFDLPFTFANFDKWSHAPFVAGLDVEERDEISSVIHRAFIAFARDGRSEHGGLESWPAYTLDDRTTLVLDKTSGPVGDPARIWREAQELGTDA